MELACRGELPPLAPMHEGWWWVRLRRREGVVVLSRAVETKQGSLNDIQSPRVPRKSGEGVVCYIHRSAATLLLTWVFPWSPTRRGLTTRTTASETRRLLLCSCVRVCVTVRRLDIIPHFLFASSSVLTALFLEAN